MSEFRLQRVLELRKRREEELQQRLAAATAARSRSESMLTLLTADEQRRREELGSLLLGGRVEPGYVQELGLMLEARGASIARQREELEKALSFEDEERGRLIVATVERRALERLREQHDERERVRSVRKEAVLLDEIGTARAARQRLAAAAAAAVAGATAA